MATQASTLYVIFNGTPQWNTPETVGLSGGDRILFEALRHWQRKAGEPRLVLLTDPSGLEMLKLYDAALASTLEVRTSSVSRRDYSFLPWLFPIKTRAMKRLIDSLPLEAGAVFFSASDLFPDSLPGAYARREHPGSAWCCALYLFALPPWSPRFPYRGLIPWLRGLLYWASQRYCYRRILRHADTVVTCNDADRDLFLQAGYPAERLWSIYGGVDLSIPDSVPEPVEKPYAACYMARLHPQKGPLEALKTWRLVLREMPEARLALIGNGPQEFALRKYLAEHHMEESVALLGYLDGVEKYRVLKSARLFLHPAIYDTGGMAAAEGMAAGLPVVAFNHEGFDYCFPKGIRRTAPSGDCEALAASVLMLLNDEAEYQRLRAEAVSYSRTWDWSARSALLLEHILKAREHRRV